MRFPCFPLLFERAKHLVQPPAVREGQDVDRAAGGACSTKNIRMFPRQPEGTETAHAQTGDSATVTILPGRVMGINVRHEFLRHETLAVLIRYDLAIDIPRVSHAGTDDDDTETLRDLREVRADGEPVVFILVVAMQQVDNREGLLLLRRGENNDGRDVAPEVLTGNSVADDLLRMGKAAEQKEYKGEELVHD